MHTQTVPLTPLDGADIPHCITTCCQDSNGKTDFTFMGCALDEELARGVADGLVDPNTQVTTVVDKLDALV